jgi:hypothetical protein
MAQILEVRIKSLSKFRKLLALEAQKRAIEEEIDELKGALLPVVRRLDQVTCDGATFVVQRRANWKFSAKVAELEGRVKAQKQYEVENHIARKQKPTEYIKVNR